MSNLFLETKIYSFGEIEEIATANKMAVIDCIKEENMISLEGFNGKDLGGTNLFEFDMIKNDKFKLRWFEPNWRKLV